MRIRTISHPLFQHIHNNASHLALVCHTNSRSGHASITDCTGPTATALECPTVDCCSYQVLQKSINMWFKIWNGARARRHVYAISRDSLLCGRETGRKERERRRETDRARARLLVSGYQCYVGNIQSALVAPGDSYKNEQQSINSTR